MILSAQRLEIDLASAMRSPHISISLVKSRVRSDAPPWPDVDRRGAPILMVPTPAGEAPFNNNAVVTAHLPEGDVQLPLMYLWVSGDGTTSLYAVLNSMSHKSEFVTLSKFAAARPFLGDLKYEITAVPDTGFTTTLPSLRRTGS